MKRKIIIITNPGEDNADNYCKGVFVDAENYKIFFKAPYGGYWFDSEIQYLNKPSKSSIQSELTKLVDFDFSIIIFCGHGWHSSISDSTILQLNNSENIDSNDLRKNANKRIIILDCCRKVHKEYITEGLIKARMFSESIAGLTKLSPTKCRTCYNLAIEKCSNQLIVAFGADISEFAGDSETKGGYYSSSLLKACVTWVDNTINSVDLTSNYYTRRFPNCHNDSIPLVEKQSGNTQHPKIEKPRISDANDYLPFLILA